MFIRADTARHLRAVWLGPKGARLPFEWTYGQLFLAFCLWIPAGIITGLIQVGLTGIPLFFIAGPVGFGPPIALVLTTLAMKGVSEDEPLGYRLAMFAGKLRRRPAVPTEAVTIALSHPPITDSPPGVVRALTGTRPPNLVLPHTTVKETHVVPHHTAPPFPVFPQSPDVTAEPPAPRRAAETVEIGDGFNPDRGAVPQRAAV